MKLENIKVGDIIKFKEHEMKGISKFKSSRTVKPLPFVKPVGAKKSVKAAAAKKPEGIKRKLSLSKFPEPPDAHTKEHQPSNYLAYEREKGSGTRKSSK